MARAIKPGGHFMFTILSDTAMVALYPNAEQSIIDAYQTPNGYDSSFNSQLETIDVSGDYYRNVWYKKKAIEDAHDGLFKSNAIYTIIKIWSYASGFLRFHFQR